jgi:hypothetical protein
LNKQPHPAYKIIAEKRLPIHEWCLDCPELLDMITTPDTYGTTPEGVAYAAYRQCYKPPDSIPSTQKGAINYFETQVPRCEFGKHKQAFDAEIEIRKRGLNVISLFTVKPTDK